MTSLKLEAGTSMPSITVHRAGGGQLNLGRSPSWTMVVVYRGKHCPLCRAYLKTLNGLIPEYAAIQTTVQVVSADAKEKAESQRQEEGWDFDVGYGLSVEQMRDLGLYISEPRSPQETDRAFPEPGLYIVNPEGKIHIVDISNAPFARPDLHGVLHGLRFIQQKQYPIRGTLA